MILDMPDGPIFANTGGGTVDPAKPAAVLVHGAGCDHSIWGGQSRYLAHHGASVLSIDLPGHGRSGGAPLESIEDIAAFLIRLIKTAKLERPVLIGHSMGALAVLEAAARLGPKLAGLGLCGVAAKMPVHPALLDAAKANDLSAAELIAGWGHGSRAHRGGNPAHGLWMLRQAVALIDGSRPGVLHTDLAACNAYQGATDAAEKLSCPTLFLLGRGDKMTPVKACQPLIDAVADAQTVILPQAGHMMMIEAPHDARRALMGLVQRVEGALAA